MLSSIFYLMLAVAASQTPDACAGTVFPDRLSASGAYEGAAVLIQAAQAADATRLACLHDLAAEAETRQDWMGKRPFQAARAAVALSGGDPSAAVSILEPMVGHLHHTVPIEPDLHALLSRAYEALGRYPEAEGQRRLAIAAMESQRPFALSEADIRDLHVLEPMFGLLPIDPPGAELNTLDLTSIRAAVGGRRYDTVLLFAEDQDGAAALRVARTVDCATRAGAIEEIQTLNPTGSVLSREGPEDPRESTNALIDHRRRLVCAIEPSAEREPADVAAALRLFRAR
jgi:hypothetical protein